MQTIKKSLSLMAIVLLICFSISTNVTAQSPADDPGIGGPGSPSVGVGGDGGPVVPFDNSLNLVFLSTTIGIIYLANRRGVIALK